MIEILNVEEKEDSPDKLSAIAGKPTKHFLFAVEVNKITDSIKQDQLLRLPNRVAKFSTQYKLEGSSLLYDNGTNIGIGEESTDARLHIKAQGRLSTDKVFRIRNNANTLDLLRFTGYGEAFLGEGAGHNTISLRNTVHGRYSLHFNVNGENNTVFGHQSLVYAEGYKNTSVGSFCAQIDSYGNNLTMCKNSVFIGYNLRPRENDCTNEIIIGTDVNGDGSNSVVLGNSSIARTRLQGQVIVGQFLSHPIGIEGAIYYNTDERRHFGFNGSEWIPFY